MSPQTFDTLILAVMVVGLSLASVRFYQDMTRPLPRQAPPTTPSTNDDTQPSREEANPHASSDASDQAI